MEGVMAFLSKYGNYVLCLTVGVLAGVGICELHNSLF